MFALTHILSMAEADPPESRNTDIEMTASQFAAAGWLAEFLARRTIDTSSQTSAARETHELNDPIAHEEMAPA